MRLIVETRGKPPEHDRIYGTEHRDILDAIATARMVRGAVWLESDDGKTRERVASANELEDWATQFAPRRRTGVGERR